MLGATPVSHDRVRMLGNSMRSRAPDDTGTPTGARVPHSLHHIATDRRRAPNGLPFSWPRAHYINCQKANDLGRAAVGWNGGLGGLATDARVLPA